MRIYISKSSSVLSLFDTNSIRAYAVLRSKTRDKLVMMPISVFLTLASAEPEDKVKKANVDAIFNTQELLRNIPYLYIRHTNNPSIDEVYGHEGRHRARKLLALGYKEMPVRLSHDSMRWPEANIKGSPDYVKIWPEHIMNQDHTRTLDFPVARSESDKDFK